MRRALVTKCVHTRDMDLVFDRQRNAARNGRKQHRVSAAPSAELPASVFTQRARLKAAQAGPGTQGSVLARRAERRRS